MVISDDTLHKRLDNVQNEMKSINNVNEGLADALLKLTSLVSDAVKSTEDFKDEMRDFKDETKKSISNTNKEYGKLSKKLGTFVEDIFAPNTPFVAEKFLGLSDYDRLIISDKRKHPKTRQQREFDTVVLYGRIVILNESKATMRLDDIKEFAKFIKSGLFFEYYPEYTGYQLIPMFSSFRIDESMVKFMTKNRIYAMALDGGFATLLNANDMK